MLCAGALGPWRISILLRSVRTDGEGLTSLFPRADWLSFLPVIAHVVSDWLGAGGTAGALCS